MNDIGIADLARYAAAVRKLDRALRTLTASGDDVGLLDTAVADYVRASSDVFDIGGTSFSAPAVLGGDLRVLGELARVGETPEGALFVEASDDLGFLDDMAVVSALAAGRAPGFGSIVVAGDDDVASARASIDSVVRTGLDTLTGIVTAAVFPHVSELPQIVTGLFGSSAGEAFGLALSALQSKVGTIVRAVTAVMKAIVDKIVSLLGQPAIDQLTEWVKDLVGVSDLYEVALGVPRVRAAAAALETAPDAATRASRIGTIVQSHERYQKWVAWGSRGLGYAGPKLYAVQPWGPAVTAAVSVVLMVGCAWLTADHLDSFSVRWLPHRFDGIGTVLV